jgi:hypothetical protein
VVLVGRLDRGRHRKDPSPVPLRLEKTPERNTLSPGERAMAQFPFFLSARISPEMWKLRVAVSDRRPWVLKYTGAQRAPLQIEEVRQKMHCLLIGWVLMPEHFHTCTTTS